MVVKDEHFTKKTREEMLVTTFDDSVLDHTNLAKHKKVYRFHLKIVFGLPLENL